MARRTLRSLGGSGRRRRPLAALAVVVIVGVAVAVVLSARSPSPSRPASDPGVTGATTVQRRDLVATDTEAGTLSYSGPETVYDRLSGTITWLPTVGQAIKPGGTLFKVDGEPVILLNGSTPAYRTLSSADSDGADITQLNRNLVDLGFDSDGIVIDDIWQPATTVGVELLQESLGETATGILSLGEVVFLPGEQLVSTVEGTLGAGGGSGAAADTRVAAPPAEFVSLRTAGSTCPAGGTSTTTSTTTTSTTSTTSCTTTTTPPTTTTPTTTTPTTTAPNTPPPANAGKPPPSRRGHRRRNAGQQALAALTALLKAESAQLKAEAAELRADAAAKQGTGNGNSNGKNNGKNNSATSSHSSGSPTSSSGNGTGSGSGSGSGSNAGTAVLETTSTHLVVTVDLAASSQSEAVVRERVTVEMPAGNTVNGRITAVSPVAQSSSGSGTGANSGAGGSGGGGNGNSGSSASTIPVTVTLSGHHTGAGLDQAAVSVNFVQQRARNVLSVPVTALLATAGGNFSVQTAAAPHQLIPVTTGLFAAGYVQISGPGVYSGLQVTDSQG